MPLDDTQNPAPPSESELANLSNDNQIAPPPPPADLANIFKQISPVASFLGMFMQGILGLNGAQHADDIRRKQMADMASLQEADKQQQDTLRENQGAIAQGQQERNSAAMLGPKDAGFSNLLLTGAPGLPVKPGSAGMLLGMK